MTQIQPTPPRARICVWSVFLLIAAGCIERGEPTQRVRQAARAIGGDPGEPDGGPSVCHFSGEIDVTCGGSVPLSPAALASARRIAEAWGVGEYRGLSCSGGSDPARIESHVVGRGPPGDSICTMHVEAEGPTGGAAGTPCDPATESCCTNTSDCLTAFLCVRGRCRLECETDNDCRPGEQCTPTGTGSARACAPVPPGEECPTGFVHADPDCTGSDCECVQHCSRRPGTCSSPEICDPATGRCTACSPACAPPAVCSEGSDPTCRCSGDVCPANTHCATPASGSGEPECACGADGVCPPDQRCVRDGEASRCRDICAGHVCPEDQHCEVESGAPVCRPGAPTPCTGFTCPDTERCVVSPAGTPQCQDACLGVMCDPTRVCVAHRHVGSCVDKCDLHIDRCPDDARCELDEENEPQCVDVCTPNPCPSPEYCAPDPNAPHHHRCLPAEPGGCAHACAFPTACIGGRCVAPACVPACAPPQTCVGGVCVGGCLSDFDCPFGQECAFGACRPVSVDCNAACRSARQCGSHLVPSAGSVTCFCNPSHCAPGESCVLDGCQAPGGGGGGPGGGGEICSWCGGSSITYGQCIACGGSVSGSLCHGAAAIECNLEL